MRWPRYWSCGRWRDFLGWNFMAFRLAWSQRQVALKRDPTLAPTLAPHFMVQLGWPAVLRFLPSEAIARWKAGRAEARPYISGYCVSALLRAFSRGARGGARGQNCGRPLQAAPTKAKGEDGGLKAAATQASEKPAERESR